MFQTFARPLAPSRDLLLCIDQECSRPVDSDLQILLPALQARFGDAMSAVLFYGSCLRDGVTPDGLVDLYVIVDSYTKIPPAQVGRWSGRWLAPTVFVLQTSLPHNRTLRAKCAVIASSDFEQGTHDWFHSYLWARFSQPSRLVFCRDERTRLQIHRALANAVLRTMSETLPLQASTFHSASFWERVFSLSYGTELRPEAENRPARIVSYDRDYYARVTRAATASIPLLHNDPATPDTYRHTASPVQRLASRVRWKLRRHLGRAMNVLRLIKSFFTFEDGVGYVIWKLERHLGEPVQVSARLRRYPLIFCWPLLWRLIRERRLR